MRDKAVQGRKRVRVSRCKTFDERIEVFKEDLARQFAEETYDLIQDLRRKGVIVDE